MLSLSRKKGIKTRNREIVIAIDGEHVVRSIPSSKKRNGTKLNSIRDIEFCSIDQTDPTGRSFTLAFKTDKDYHVYTTPTKEMAREIVGKIRYLQQEMSGTENL